MTGPSTNRTEPRTHVHLALEESGPRSEDIETKISVIIPTFNESSRISDLISRLDRETGIEIIVVDGGSADGTPEIVESLGCRLIRSPKGRACQMNAGAAVASSHILLFLHADTVPPPGFSEYIRGALTHGKVVAGAFRIAYDTYTPMLHVIAWSANLRSRWFQLPYGDQALFVSKGLFNELDGFPEVPVMEDLALVRLLRKRGRIFILPVHVTTSSRSWLSVGTWRVTFFHVTGLLAFWLGVSPRKIQAWFQRGGYYHSEPGDGN